MSVICNALRLRRSLLIACCAVMSLCILGCGKDAETRSKATPKSATTRAKEAPKAAVNPPKGVDPSVKVDESAVEKAMEPQNKAQKAALTGAGQAAMADVHVQLFFHPPSPKVGQMFAVETHITKGGKPVKVTDFKVDSTMPEHGHGMMTKPQHRQTGPGRFASEGFKLHMHGKWVFEVTGNLDGKALRVEMKWQQAPEAL